MRNALIRLLVTTRIHLLPQAGEGRAPHIAVILGLRAKTSVATSRDPFRDADTGIILLDQTPKRISRNGSYGQAIG